jgi:quercetin dioxygenase-like cupin family protein
MLLRPTLFEQLAEAQTTAPSAASASGGSGVTIREMLSYPLPAIGRNGTMAVVELAPGAGSPPHRHPGPVFGYVLEGTIESALENGATLTYQAGDMWYEASRNLHRVARNPSASTPAKILVFFILDKGQPLLIPAGDRT